jgi:hypothetical protein
MVQVTIGLDEKTGKVALNAPIEDETGKLLVENMLVEALRLAVNYRPSQLVVAQPSLIEKP